MFSGCHSAHEVAEVYRRRGFLEVSDVFDRVSVAASRSLGAVTVPEELGRHVRDRLQQDRRCKSVPILSYARPGRDWAFLGGREWGRGLGAHTVAELEAHGVRVLATGQRIWLPMSNNRIGWYWIVPPVDAASVPSRTTVITTVRALLEELRPRSRRMARWP